MSGVPYWPYGPPNDSTPQVVVTGVGLALDPGWAHVDPMVCRENAWAAIRAGKSRVRRVSLGDASYLVCGSDPREGLPSYGDGNAITLRGLLHRAGDIAEQDAGLGRMNFDRDRAACLVGLSKGIVGELAQLHRMIDSGRIDDPIFAWSCAMYGLAWPNFAATNLANRYGLRGPCMAPVAACATGLIAAIQGADLIRRGLCDVAFVGAADASIEPTMMAAFQKMKALAHDGGEPSRAARPWDRGRSGFVVGEGAAILVLEREDHARSRGVLPYAVFAGGAFGSDAYHITDLNPDPTNLAHWIGQALRNSDASTTDIDYINVHGTATKQNDPLECRAIRRAFGSHADTISCSANKPQIGHLLGAAGAAELAITCLAIRDGFVPPTLNLDDPDPACDLDGTPHVGKSRDIRAALKISIGFGGHLAAAVLRKPDGPRRLPVSVHD